MKKLLLTLIVACSAFAANALTPFAEFAPIIAGDNNPAFNLQAGISHKVHPILSVGAGVGITQSWNFSYGPMIPIFVRGQLEKSVGGLTPYFSFDVGYEINTANTDHGAVLVNPMVGLRFGKFYGGIGYLGHCYTGKYSGTGSNFALRLGMNF